ncbi:MAG: hypothetical protein PVJ67_03405 [Candidatus Pacearchaeota archaeon]|jgi:hypothetical protein
MLVKILGGIDLIAGIIMMFNRLVSFPNEVLIFIGIVLIVKASFGLFKNFASGIDLFAGIIILFLIFFSVPIWINIIAGVLLIQKGLMSFI